MVKVLFCEIFTHIMFFPSIAFVLKGCVYATEGNEEQDESYR